MVAYAIMDSMNNREQMSPQRTAIMCQVLAQQFQLMASLYLVPSGPSGPTGPLGQRKPRQTFELISEVKRLEKLATQDYETRAYRRALVQELADRGIREHRRPSTRQGFI